MLGDLSTGSGDGDNILGQAVTVVCPNTSGEESVAVSREGEDARSGQSVLGDMSAGTGGVVAKAGQAVTVVCPGTSGEVGDDASGGQPVLGGVSSGGQSVLGDVSKGAEGDAAGGQAVPQVTTFMSYNSTGIDHNKCKWIKYVAVDYGVNYAALHAM